MRALIVVSLTTVLWSCAGSSSLPEEDRDEIRAVAERVLKAVNEQDLATVKENVVEGVPETPESGDEFAIYLSAVVAGRIRVEYGDLEFGQPRTGDAPCVGDSTCIPMTGRVRVVCANGAEYPWQELNREIYFEKVDGSWRFANSWLLFNELPLCESLAPG